MVIFFVHHLAILYPQFNFMHRYNCHDNYNSLYPSSIRLSITQSDILAYVALGSWSWFLINNICSRELKFQRHTQTAEFTALWMWQDKWILSIVKSLYTHTLIMSAKTRSSFSQGKRDDRITPPTHPLIIEAHNSITRNKPRFEWHHSLSFGTACYESVSKVAAQNASRNSRLLGRETTGWMILIWLIWAEMTVFLQFEIRDFSWRGPLMGYSLPSSAHLTARKCPFLSSAYSVHVFILFHNF